MKINKIIKILIISDFSIISSFNLVSPIFAIFIAEQIIGGGVMVVGFASTVYLLVFSLARLPISRIVDQELRERGRVFLLIGGSILMSSCYFFYIFAEFPWQIYLLEALIGLGYAGNAAVWFDLFTRYIDKDRESFEWGIHGSIACLGSAATAAIGGILAERFGFAPIFILVGIFGLVGSLVPIAIYKNFAKISQDQKVKS